MSCYLVTYFELLLDEWKSLHPFCATKYYKFEKELQISAKTREVEDYGCSDVLSKTFKGQRIQYLAHC